MPKNRWKKGSVKVFLEKSIIIALTKKLFRQKKLLSLKRNFLKKYLIWQAIGEDSNVSEPFISEGTMNGETYFRECIGKRLLPFIAERNVLFWLDMATVHYIKNLQVS